MSGRVVIDCFPERARNYHGFDAIIAVDVIRATTTALTSLSTGRRCFPTRSLEDAIRIARSLDDALLVGEIGGDMPIGFNLTNSPSTIACRPDTWRPMVLVSTSGTVLLDEAKSVVPCVYAASLQNWRRQAAYAASRHGTIAILGAGSRGTFRREDQLCCAWIAEAFMEAGFDPDDATTRIVSRWSGVPVDEITQGTSADYLRRTGQLDDLDFIIRNVEVLDFVARLDGEELLEVTD
jgi:2-phosphosulfolactate phosphatase